MTFLFILISYNFFRSFAMNIRQAATAVGPVSALNFTYYDNCFKNRTWQGDNSEGCVFYFSPCKYNSKTTRAIKAL